MESGVQSLESNQGWGLWSGGREKELEPAVVNLEPEPVL